TDSLFLRSRRNSESVEGLVRAVSFRSSCGFGRMKPKMTRNLPNSGPCRRKKRRSRWERTTETAFRAYERSGRGREPYKFMTPSPITPSILYGLQVFTRYRAGLLHDEFHSPAPKLRLQIFGIE